MSNFIMVNDKDGDPIIVRTDLIEQVYQLSEAVDGSEEHDQVLTCIVLSSKDEDDEDGEVKEELVVRTPVTRVFFALAQVASCASEYNKDAPIHFSKEVTAEQL